MNTTNVVVLTAVVVVAGRWANDKPLSIRMAVGAAGLALGLAAINEANAPLASKMALLVLLAAVFSYGPGIVKKAGLTK